MSEQQSTKEYVDNLIQHYLTNRSTQQHIPVAKATFTPDGNQVLFLVGTSPTDHRQHLCVLECNPREPDEDRNEVAEEFPWRPAYDLAALTKFTIALSHEQVLKLERQRIRAHGITNYVYHAQSNSVIFNYGQHLIGGTFTKNEEEALSLVQIGDPRNDDQGTRMDPQMTPDGKFIIFVRNKDLWIGSNNPEVHFEQPLTDKHQRNPRLSCGAADFIMEEEFDLFTSFWVAPFIDENPGQKRYHVLYMEYDTSEVPSITLSSADGAESHVWPRAGEKNSKFEVKLLTIDVPVVFTGSLSGVQEGELKQKISKTHPWAEYIVRAGWTTRRGEFFLNMLDRDQMRSEIDLYLVDQHCSGVEDPEGGGPPGLVLVEESGGPWYNVDNGRKFVDDGLIYTSESETGFRHLYLLPYPDHSQAVPLQSSESKMDVDDLPDEDANHCRVTLRMTTPNCEPKQLTSGEWCISRKPIWFDKKNKIVYFSGYKDTCLERHLYGVYLDRPNELVRLTPLGNDCDMMMNDECNRAFIVYSNLDTLQRIRICEVDPHLAEKTIEFDTMRDLQIPITQKSSMFEYNRPEIFQVPTPDGLTLNCLVIKPAEFDGSRSFPTIVHTYGGPHVQLIGNRSALRFNSRYALWNQAGFVVALCDGRGSDNRGLGFEGQLKYRMGQVEIQDQVTMVQALVEKGITDPNRVAITGFSYGGYMSLLAMCQRPDIFKIGVSGAPVVDWALYDTGYTERYMGTPQQHTDAYNGGNILSYAENFPDEENRLIIIHGLSDENVHFHHTEKLISGLIKNAKPYILKIFPQERHGIRRGDNFKYMETSIVKHLLDFL